MKTAKRILAVILLAVVLCAVGYLVYTGSRLPIVSVEEMTEEITETYEGSVTDEETAETATETTYAS